MKVSDFSVGEHVTTSGYPGTVQRVTPYGMLEVRLASGLVAVCPSDVEKSTRTPAHSRSARVVMLVSVEMRPPKVGERGWWAVPGATPEAVLRDVISEIEDTGPGWIADESQAGRPDTVTVHVDWTREEVP